MGNCMEIQVLEEEANKIKFKVIGETHTIGNLLKKELFKDKSVEFAGYVVEHPLIKEAIFTVKTTKKNPRKSINDAIDRIREQLDDFVSQVKKI